MKEHADATCRSMNAMIVLALKQYVADDEGVVEKPKEPRSKPFTAPVAPNYGKWFCSTCNTLSRIPRCAKDPSHKVTPA